MTRPTQPLNTELLAACRFVDIGHVFDRLSDDQIRSIRRAVEPPRLPSQTVGALLPEGCDLARLGSSPQCVPSGFWIATNDLDRLQHDLALHDFLNRGVPVLLVFEEFDDCRRFCSIVAALPLPDDEPRLDHADGAGWDEDDEASEARCNHDYQRDCDDEPSWDDAEPRWDDDQ
ncbi:MAG TPA: hypothetical protein VGR70_00290 [Stellaceae bacterium]|nr:hypothetical protein [Stellaceae bacterium]